MRTANCWSCYKTRRRLYCQNVRGSKAGSQARTNSCPTWATSQKLRRLFVARHTRGLGRAILHFDLRIAPKSFSTPLLDAFEESRSRKSRSAAQRKTGTVMNDLMLGIAAV